MQAIDPLSLPDIEKVKWEYKSKCSGFDQDAKFVKEMVKIVNTIDHQNIHKYIVLYTNPNPDVTCRIYIQIYQKMAFFVDL